MTPEQIAPDRDGTGPRAERLEQGQTAVSNDRLQVPIDVYAHAEAAAPMGSTTLAHLIDSIRGDEFAEQVAAVREAVAAGNGKLASDLKKRLPAVSLSGAVDGRRKAAVAEGRFAHSGFLQVDIDAKDNDGLDLAETRRMLIEDERIVAVFASPSGNGLKAIARILPDPAQHLASFHAVEKHLADLGVRIDTACKDPVRLCFVSHDPAAFYDPTRAACFEPIEPQLAPPSEATTTAAEGGGGAAPRETGGKRDWTLGDLSAMLEKIGRPVYDVWLRICSGAWAEFGEQATEVLQRHWPEEKPGEYAEKFAHRLATVSFGTVVHHATAAGWKPSRRSTAKPPAQPEPEEAPEPPRFFYDGGKYYLDTESDFVPLDVASVRRHLKAAGLTPPDIDAELCRIQREMFVSHAGPLAGHSRGLHEVSGAKLLATCSPNIIPAAPGGFAALWATLEALLYDDDARGAQLFTFLGWLRYAREALLAGSRRPGQVIALAGPVGSGKSLLIDLVEAALGGRRANPCAVFSGRTAFNGDLIAAELLAVDDEQGSSDIRARKAFASAIKAALFSGGVRVEAKHRNPFTFRPVWRMMVATNDEPEALQVLPPITPDIADKICLFRCHKRPLPMPVSTLAEKEAFWAQLLADLPGLLHEIASLELPEDMREERCGVRAFHHPAILANLHALSPEAQLEELIDRAAEAGGLQLPWQGTASTLKALLVGCHATGRDAERLLGAWAPAAGTYLGRLEGKGRVARLPLRDGVQRWEIR